MSYVEIRELTKKFDTTTVFENINLDVDEGKICVLVGPSGCGKTTLLRAVAGLTHPDSGVIRLDQRDVTKVEAKNRGVGMVFQHYALFPNMTVEQNLAFGLEQKKLPRPEIRKKVDGVIELMGLGPRAKARPAALSGGQKQRVALARALVLEPKLLLLDEPLSALDAQIRKRLRDELKRLQHDVGFTAIFVTHDQEEALMLGDQVAIMQAGRFVQIGAPAEIYNRPANLAVANFVGDFNIFDPATVERLFGVAAQTSSWAVRPEAIDISPADRKASANGGAVETEVTVMAVQILGAMVRHYTRAQDVMIKVDLLNKPDQRLFQIGEKARISIARNAIAEMNE
ncbi:ABC transporter ATP-binding protein [Aestuariivirga sp. YIM B02566]|uniref:ABC transporter ATP-binding protein n=1 Tax=Taklimakanibacter albus TaxID=2800327 RepID=A0ACC5RDL5_9HYPH|nr:ABC transporter ATP-binding protein [Aestuariivirga sp. YIM B02566]MBK1870796.1 ABC transporter ATP-binding protein [Aestuariivirga sp. YIM B02566]